MRFLLGRWVGWACACWTRRPLRTGPPGEQIDRYQPRGSQRPCRSWSAFLSSIQLFFFLRKLMGFLRALLFRAPIPVPVIPPSHSSHLNFNRADYVHGDRSANLNSHRSCSRSQMSMLESPWLVRGISVWARDIRCFHIILRPGLTWNRQLPPQSLAVHFATTSP